MPEKETSCPRSKSTTARLARESILEIAERHEHPVARIVGHAQRRRIDDADEAWSAAAV